MNAEPAVLDLVWVGELPPRTEPSPAFPHAEWAAAMRSRPGWWAVPMPASSAGMISGAGCAAPYRPRRSFETEIRGRVLYACYVGAEDAR